METRNGAFLFAEFNNNNNNIDQLCKMESVSKHFGA